MTQGAGVLVNGHRVVRKMAEGNAACRIGNVVEPSYRMINQTMLAGVVWMADQATGRVGSGADDVWDRDA